VRLHAATADQPRAAPSQAGSEHCHAPFDRLLDYGGHPSRDDWLAARLQEGALWEQLHRVRSQRYVDYGPMPGRLRVV
jgi:hypothetical protein